MKRLPFSYFPSFQETLTLEEVPYTFRFDWNSRGAFWSMDIYDRDGNALLLGRKVSLFNELISQFPNRGLPSGKLYVVDPSLMNFTPISQYDIILERCSLLYVEEAEFATV